MCGENKHFKNVAVDQIVNKKINEAETNRKEKYSEN